MPQIFGLAGICSWVMSQALPPTHVGHCRCRTCTLKTWNHSRWTCGALTMPNSQNPRNLVHRWSSVANSLQVWHCSCLLGRDHGCVQQEAYMTWCDIFRPKDVKKSAEKSHIIRRLECSKRALWASFDGVISGQACSLKLQRVFTLDDGYWLPLCASYKHPQSETSGSWPVVDRSVDFNVFD